jgi:hypothetical protein
MMCDKSADDDKLFLEFAPSFEDMDWAIEAEINENYTLDNKSLHLSPEFQYSLNCAWLNLKVAQI